MSFLDQINAAVSQLVLFLPCHSSVYFQHSSFSKPFSTKTSHVPLIQNPSKPRPYNKPQELCMIWHCIYLWPLCLPLSAPAAWSYCQSSNTAVHTCLRISAIVSSLCLECSSSRHPLHQSPLTPQVFSGGLSLTTLFKMAPSPLILEK